MTRQTPEGRVLRACLDFLRLNGIAAWRINVAGVPLHDGSGKYRRAPSRGIADIIGIAAGRVTVEPGPHTHAAPVPLAVEVKSATGRQSASQVAFARAWEQAGGLYIIARSVVELGAKLRAAGVETKTR